jgi:hypothetical protein
LSDTPEIANAIEDMVVSPALIQELFDKDPLDLTTEEIDVIIAKFRSDRMNYLQPEAKTPKKVSSSKAPAQLDMGLDLSLDDLGL